MSDSPAAVEPSALAPSPKLSIPFVIGATLLAVLGMTGVLFFVITFQWIYFLGVIPMAIGALMYFSPYAGPNHA